MANPIPDTRYVRFRRSIFIKNIGFHMMRPAKDLTNGEIFGKSCALLTVGRLRTPYLDQMDSIQCYNTPEKDFSIFFDLPSPFSFFCENPDPKNCSMLVNDHILRYKIVPKKIKILYFLQKHSLGL